MVDTARKSLIVGAFLMPMLILRVAGTETATTDTGLTVSDGFFFVSAVLLALSVRRPKVSPTPLWHLGAFLVVVGGVTASFFAVVPLSSISVVGRMIFVLVVWQWTVRNLVTEERWLRAVMTAYAMGCAVSGLVAVLQLEFHLLVSLGGVYEGRAFGLARHPDDTGSFLALGLTLAVGLALHPGIRRRWYHHACICSIALGLIVSGSVSGMLCGLIGVAVVVARRGVSVGKLLAVGGLLVSIYAVATVIQGSNQQSLNPIERFQKATGPESSGGNSIGPRVGTIKAAWDGIVDSPVLGHGLDVATSLVYLDRYSDTYYPTHNFVLMAWYQGGILFLVGDLLCIAAAFGRLVRSRRRDPYRDTVLGGAFAVIGFALQGPMMFDRYFWLPFVLAVCFPLAGERAVGPGVVGALGTAPAPDPGRP